MSAFAIAPSAPLPFWGGVLIASAAGPAGSAPLPRGRAIPMALSGDILDAELLDSRDLPRSLLAGVPS